MFCKVDSQSVINSFFMNEWDVNSIDMIFLISLHHLWNILNTWRKMFRWHQLFSYICILNDTAFKSKENDLVICAQLLQDDSNTKVELSFLNHFKHEKDAVVQSVSSEKLFKNQHIFFLVCVNDDDSILDTPHFEIFIIWVVDILCSSSISSITSVHNFAFSIIKDCCWGLNNFEHKIWK